MLRKILLLAITSGLAARAYRAYVRHRDEGPLASGDKQSLRVWENEGGAPKAPPQTPAY